MTAVKIPRGKGYDKRSLARYIKLIERHSLRIDTFARSWKLNVDILCLSIQQGFPDWWETYVALEGHPPENDCEYCERTFYLQKAGQRFCSIKCGRTQKTDAEYFGGQRRNTVGLAEGICQCCGDEGKTLSSHHVWGKANDPENSCLVALCVGCHELVTALAMRKASEQPIFWERLIDLVLRRRYGGRQPDPFDIGVGVGLDRL